ncbi:unnamed protein product, partial [Iphiclides podalirius]
MVPLFFLLVGFISADPLEFRSNFEFLEYSTNIDEPKYRLLDIVQPINQYVDLDVYLSQSRFNGLVQIDVNVRQNLTQIVVHQNVVAIQGVNVINSNNRPVPLDVSNPFEVDSYYEILKINFAGVIPIGRYNITIRYLGQINENPVDRGFYKGYYYYGNQKRVSANRIRETFLPTPIVSVYLVAFHVSDFIATNSSATSTKPFQIISRQGPVDQHDYAADIGMRITNSLDEYFGIEYYFMGQGQPMKNDHIALPDFPSGAMENWGMVNYREAYLLYDENNTNLINKIFIATIMAHELAHKWFGNLVTCFWWSNLWLNESYASFFEYFGAHYADPSLELDDQFVVDYVHSALSWDAGASATPMNWSSVATNPSVSSHFSTTSYAKGASVLRMLEHFVGFTTFRNALRIYLNEHAYGIGYPEDMYAAFRRAVSQDASFARDFPNIDIGRVFDSWVQNPGAPVVNVNVNMSNGEITVSQIVNDVLFFIRAGTISIRRAFDVLSFLRNETDYYVWAAALGQLDWIRSRLEHLPTAYEEFNAYLMDLMETVIQHLGYNERPTDSVSTILNRMQIMNYACNMGHAGCIADSLQKWRAFRQNASNLVPVNARRYVYCTAMRQNGASDYNFLFQRYNASENTADMVVMLRTLACTRDNASLEQ